MWFIASLIFAHLARAESGTPLFLWSNGRTFPTERVAKTVQASDAQCLISRLGYGEASCQSEWAPQSISAAQLLVSFRIPAVQTFDVARSSFVKEVSRIGSSMFLPFVEKEVDTSNLGKNILRVTDFEEFKAHYDEEQGYDYVEFLTRDLAEAETDMVSLREWALAKPDLDMVTVLGASPKGWVSGHRRRLLTLGGVGEEYGEDDDVTYEIMCTSTIMTGLLTSLMLLTIAYCGYSNLMAVEVPLRTPNANLVIRKEF